MKKLVITIFVLLNFFTSNVWASKEDKNQSVTYPELIQRYVALSNQYNTCDFISFGETDSGEPLHLFLLNSSGEFYPEAIHNKTVILVQNGIHAGESCGIDASIEWAEELLEKQLIPDNVVIGIIPVYNIGGMKNRGCCSRANQNGPEEHGFRGNARNLDLNRDYIKSDSKNAMAFYRLFHWLNPELFVDTHTSNGADYQYTMTLLTTRKEKLDAHLSQFLVQKIAPYLYANFDSLTPYVNVMGTTPNDGIVAFNDSPRFSTGYASLFNCIGFTTEAHMWKSFDARKKATAEFLKLLTSFAHEHSQELIENKRISDTEYAREFEALNLRLDTTKSRELPFLSFTPEYRYSEILGRNQLYYNRNKPEEIKIRYFDSYSKTEHVHVPKYYVVKSAWKEVIERLQANHIEMRRISGDTSLDGIGLYVKSFTNTADPYEGHFLHKKMVVKDSAITMTFHTGDYIISTQQTGWRYLLNVLQPESEDSYFAWNFYDEILQQKEWYSAYVFEPYAQKMLDEDINLQQEYQHKLENDPKFKNGDFRLYWLYMQSSFYEKEHNRLPILKVY